MDRKVIIGVLLLMFISFIISIISYFYEPLKLSRWVFLICLVFIVFRSLDRFYVTLDLTLQDTIKTKVKYLFLVFLLLVTLSSLKFKFLDKVTSVLEPMQLYLTITTVVFGFVTFYLNKEVIDEVEEEKDEEEKEELKRANEFGKKFRRLSWFNFDYGVSKAFRKKSYLEGMFRVLVSPFVWIGRLPYSLIKWMYKEGWWYGGGLIFLTITGFILRVWNLTILDPYTDEYMHLVAGKTLIEGGALEYTRAALVTHSVTLFYWIGNASSFYEYLFWGRLPGVIFGALTTIPIYLLAKKINKSVGIISAILWVTSPWAIGVSKTVREYTYYPFFILIICLMFLKLFELIKERNFRDKRIYFLSFTVLAFIYYTMKIDTLSTLKVGLLIIIVLIVLQVLFNFKYVLRIFTNKNILIICIFLSIIVGYFLISYILNSGHLSFDSLSPDMTKHNYIMRPTGSPMNWWASANFTNIVYFLIAIGLLFFITNKNYFTQFSVFSALLLFYVFIFDRYNRPRYLFYILPFLTILVASSLYGLIKNRINYKKISKIIYILFIILFVFSNFNYENTLYPLNSNRHGYVRTTNEHHDRVEGTISFLSDKISEDDVFITTIMGSALRLSKSIRIENIHYYRYREEDRFKKVEEIVNNNQQGFMILDWRRNGYWVEGYPRKNVPINHSFMIGNTSVKLIQDDGIQVYRWE
jgi:hypothetical protein